MDTWDMVPADQGYTTKYSMEVNPGITNVFATAAFRLVFCQALYECWEGILQFQGPCPFTNVGGPIPYLGFDPIDPRSSLLFTNENIYKCQS